VNNLGELVIFFRVPWLSNLYSLIVGFPWNLQKCSCPSLQVNSVMLSNCTFTWNVIPKCCPWLC